MKRPPLPRAPAHRRAPAARASADGNARARSRSHSNACERRACGSRSAGWQEGQKRATSGVVWLVVAQLRLWPLARASCAGVAMCSTLAAARARAPARNERRSPLQRSPPHQHAAAAAFSALIALRPSAQSARAFALIIASVQRRSSGRQASSLPDDLRC